MNYTLNQLQIFLKVVQEKSITKAAEALHLTQPAVSIQLKNLQDQFEIPLTEVIGRKLYVTEFGFEIAEAAEQILNQVHAINYKTMSYRGQLTGKLRFAVVSTGIYVMPSYLSEFAKQHEGLEFEVDVTNKSGVIDALETNSVDFALVSIPPAHLNIESFELVPNALYLVGNNKVEAGSKTDLKELIKKNPMIIREEGSGTRLMMEKFLQNSNVAVFRKLKLVSNEAVKQAVISGMGISVMPQLGINQELKAGLLKIIPVKGLPIKSTWQIVWLKGKKLSPAAEAFIQYLQENNEKIKTQLD